MAHVVIEMDRGLGWEVRGDGEADTTADAVRAELPRYAVQYAHRAWVDGVMVGEVQPPKRSRVRR